MEKSRYEAPTIKEYDYDNVRRGDHISTTIMSAGSGEAWQGCRSNVAFLGHPRESSPHRRILRQLRNVDAACRSIRRPQGNSIGRLGWLLALILSIWTIPTSAAFIEYQNCLSEAYQNDTLLSLQFVPNFVNAVFTADSSHNLNVTVFGNVTGSGPNPLVDLPPPGDQAWTNDTVTKGKIEDIPDPSLATPKYTTLFNKVNVLTYQPWNQSIAFCSQLINTSCPLGPVFTGNA
jgi:hypothetical protein